MTLPIYIERENREKAKEKVHECACAPTCDVGNNGMAVNTGEMSELLQSPTVVMCARDMSTDGSQGRFLPHPRSCVCRALADILFSKLSRLFRG